MQQAASLGDDANLVADPNRPRRENLSPQSPSVQQALDHRLPSYFLQVIAGFTQADAANAHIADGKLPSHQVIQRHIARHDIAASVARSKLDVIVPPQRLNR